MSARIVTFDTETTGLDYKSGDRVIEIGLVEILGREKSKKTFQTYLNPEGKEISEGARAITNISDSDLVDAPKFSEVVDDFIDFIKDAEVVIHNYSLIHQFCSVGDYAFLGMSTGVVMDIPAFVKAAYHPAKVVGLNSIGMSRNGVSDESASLLKKAYKFLYRKGLKLEDSINKIVMLHEETNDENLKIFINSIKASTRGITR